MPARITLLSFLVAVTGAVAQEKPSPATATALPSRDAADTPRAPVEKLDQTRFRIGKITFDKQTREIRFPARVNMVEGFLEYLIVHENGKTHESLFATDISPTHLNLVFTLLRYRASPELFPFPNQSGGLSDKFPEVSEKVKSGARVSIHVEWEEHGKTRRLEANEWVRNSARNAAMPSGPWVYSGSAFEDGRFAAEFTGDIAAIFVAQSSILNYPGSDNRNDTVWLVHTDRVPAVDTKVHIIISPFSNQTNPSKS